MGSSVQPSKLPPVSPPPSQVDTQSIKGLPPVQAPPVNSGVKPSPSTSVTGSTIISNYDSKKGKGNN